MQEPIAASAMLDTPAWRRLEEQISWYDNRSTSSQLRYKAIKVFQIGMTLSLPVLAYVPIEQKPIVIAVIGAVLALCEGVQQLNQYSQLWIQYRSTAEALRHHKFLFLSRAGAYRELGDHDALKLLSESTEQIVSSEHAAWSKLASAKEQRG